MKRTLLALACAWALAPVFGSTGIAYGGDQFFNVPATDVGEFYYWVAGTPSGTVFQGFYYLDNNLSSSTVFTATSLDSFTAYNDPFFGKVADFTMHGLLGSTTGGGGRATVARFRVTQSSFPGPTYAYYTIDITLPGGTTPIFSRTGLTENNSHILVDGDGNGTNQQQADNHGVAYGDVLGETNRKEAWQADYWVADNYLQKYTYWSNDTFFRASSVRSFGCTNTGFFGQQAEFWLDGYLSNSPAALSGQRTVAHVITTKTAYTGSRIDMMYIAIYLPGHLDRPLYERLGLIGQGSRNILCK